MAKNGWVETIRRNKLTTAGIACLVVGGLLVAGYATGMIGTSIGFLLVGLIILGVGISLSTFISKYFFSKIPKVGALNLSKYEITHYKELTGHPTGKLKKLNGENFLQAFINGESEKYKIDHDNSGNQIPGKYVFIGLKQFYSLSEKKQNRGLEKDEEDAKNESQKLLDKIYTIVNSTDTREEREKKLMNLIYSLIDQYVNNALTHKNKSANNQSCIVEKDDSRGVVAERVARSLMDYMEKRPIAKIYTDSNGVDHHNWRVLDFEDFGLGPQKEKGEDNKTYLYNYIDKDTKKMDAKFSFRNFIKYGGMGAIAGGIGGQVLFYLCGDKIREFYGIVEASKDVPFLPALMTVGLGVVIGAALMICASILYSMRKDVEVPKNIDLGSAEQQSASMSLSNPNYGDMK